MAAQDGDKRALAMLYRHYYRPLLRYAYRVCGTSELAQEALQEAWIRAMRNLKRLEDPRAFRSWLYSLVRWSAIDMLRAAKRRPEESQEFEGWAPPMSGNNEDDVGELRLAIARLPAIEKQIIHLFYLDELQVREIASVLGIAAGTVKSRLNRARALLKDRFNTN